MFAKKESIYKDVMNISPINKGRKDSLFINEKSCISPINRSSIGIEKSRNGQN